MANQWYPFYPGDYSRDTAHLSLLEHGAYRLLLDHYYANGGPLPAEPFRLFSITKAFAEPDQKATLTVVALFFTETPEGFINRRADRVLSEQEEQQEKRKAKGIKAAAARWGKSGDEPEKTPEMLQASKNDAPSIENECSEQCLSNATITTTTIEPITYVRTGFSKIEQFVRECIEERRAFIRDRFGFTDAEIDIEVEEALVKCRNHSPGPDVWLYLSKWFKNRRDEINDKERRRNERGQSLGPAGPAQRSAEPGGKQGGSAALEFVDKSDEWE